MNNKEKHRIQPVWLLVIGCMLLVGSVAAFLWPMDTLPPEKQALVDQACERCRADISKRGAELESWYQGQKEVCTAKAADDLTALKTKAKMGWTVVDGGEAARNEIVAEIIRKNMYSEAECKKQTMHQVAMLLKDWLDAEDWLSIESHCHSLSTSEKICHASHYSPVHEKVNVDREMLNMLMEELGSMVGGEVLAMAVTELGVSAGILTAGAVSAPETLGIGLVVGILVDVAVGWLMDTEGKIKEKLDQAVDDSAMKARKYFENAMNKALEMRREEWIMQLKNN